MGYFKIAIKYYLILKREVETVVSVWVIWYKFCVFFKATHDGSLKVRFAFGVCVSWVVYVCVCVCVLLCVGYLFTLRTFHMHLKHKCVKYDGGC